MKTDRLEDADVVPYPVLLVLRNALGDPRDVADFLLESDMSYHQAKTDLPAPSASPTRTPPRA